MPINLFSLGAVLQHERDCHVGLVAHDVAILNHDVHILNPAPLDAPKGLGGTGDSLIDGVLETLLGDGTICVSFIALQSSTLRAEG
jgi:hypothetical protein